MNHHILKIYTQYFQPVVDGAKRSEVRFNDRDYQVGDILTLKEGELSKGEFSETGRTVSCRITYMDYFGLDEGYVSLSIGDVGLLVV